MGPENPNQGKGYVCFYCLPRTLEDMYFAERTLAHAMGFAGSYKTKSKANPTGPEVLMAPYCINLDYADLGLRSASALRGSVDDRRKWLHRVDICTRGHMAMLVRQGWPQGEALEAALSKTANMWDQAVVPPLPIKDGEWAELWQAEPDAWEEPFQGAAAGAGQYWGTAAAKKKAKATKKAHGSIL